MISASRFQHRVSDPALQVDALDGARGLAVLLVLLGHLSINGLHVIPWIDFSGAGKTGVWLFFILSAFLLTRSFLKHADHGVRTVTFWSNYFTRRFLRIFPLFSFILVISYLCSAFMGIGIPFFISGHELVQHLTLRAGKNVLWSIPPEFVYYFFLPGFALLFIVANRNVSIAFVITAAGIAISSKLWPSSLAATNAIILGPYAPIFLLGSFSALLHSSLEKRAITGGKVRYFFEGGAWLMLFLIVATIPSVYSRLAGHQVPIDYFHQDLLFFGIVWSVFILSLLHGTGFFGKLLSLKPLRYLGAISFSVYLWHMSIIDALTSISPFAPTITGWGVIIVSVVIASITYFAIEKPCINIVFGRKHRDR